jgi:hypothetical protein
MRKSALVFTNSFFVSVRNKKRECYEKFLKITFNF